MLCSVSAQREAIREIQPHHEWIVGVLTGTKDPVSRIFPRLERLVVAIVVIAASDVPSRFENIAESEESLRDALARKEMEGLRIIFRYFRDDTRWGRWENSSIR